MKAGNHDENLYVVLQGYCNTAMISISYKYIKKTNFEKIRDLCNKALLKSNLKSVSTPYHILELPLFTFYHILLNFAIHHIFIAKIVLWLKYSIRCHVSHIFYNFIITIFSNALFFYRILIDSN